MNRNTLVIFPGSAAPDFAITRASAVVVLGNLLDALFTLTFLQLEFVEEVNPLMRWAYEQSPVSFVLAKMALVGLGVVLLCLHRRSEAARLAERVCGMIYGSLVLVHMAFGAHVATRVLA